MAATDYPYDPTGESPDNWIANEVHSLEHSAAIFPLHGAFFRERCIIEGSNNGENWVPLEPMTQYRFSPLWMRASAAVGKEIHSFVIIYGEWTHCRISYQTFGQFEDRDLLEQVANANFDRKNASAWLDIKGCMSFNPIIRKPEWLELTPLEVTNAGLEAILDELRRMSSGAGKATLQQVTHIEIRQTEVETQFGEIKTEFTDIQSRFSDVGERFDHLEDFFINGWGSNTAYAGGYTYSSDGPLLTHVVNHGLDTEDVLTTFWALDENGHYHTVAVNTVITDNNTVTVTSDIAVKLIGVIQPLAANGFIYTNNADVIEHDILHNLDSAFTHVEVYGRNQDGLWESIVAEVQAVNNSVMRVTLLEAVELKVLVEPPTYNNFIWSSATPSTEHMVHHRLSTLYMGAMYWVQDANGHWYKESLGATLLDPGRLNIGLGEQRNVRVVLSPIALEGPNWEQSFNTRLTNLEQRQEELQDYMVQLRTDLENGLIGSGAVGDQHVYLETTPKALHTVVHNLDSTFVDAAFWLDEGDGVWRQRVLDYTVIDRNTLTVETLQPVALRARIRGEV